MNKNDRADLTIKQTLELDFLFWQTAMEKRREKNKDSSGTNQKRQKSEAAKLIPER